MNSSSVAFRCPHCEQAVEVEPSMIGETINCPRESCRKPFYLEPPTARSVLDEGAQSGEEPLAARPAGSEIDDDHIGGSAEETLEVVHPAMFRSSPLKFLGLAVLTTLGISGVLLWLLPITNDPAWLNEMPSLVVSLILLAVGGGWFGIWWLEMRCLTLQITNVRSLLRRGIISKETSEVRHCDVRNLQVDQNIYERLVGIGDIAISSSGQDELEIEMRGIPHPEHIANRVRQLQ